MSTTPCSITAASRRTWVRAWNRNSAGEPAPARLLAHFAQAGIDVDALALQLQRDGAQAFVKSWKELLERIAGKSAALAGADKENA